MLPKELRNQNRWEKTYNKAKAYTDKKYPNVTRVDFLKEWRKAAFWTIAWFAIFILLIIGVATVTYLHFNEGGLPFAVLIGVCVPLALVGYFYLYIIGALQMQFRKATYVLVECLHKDLISTEEAAEFLHMSRNFSAWFIANCNGRLGKFNFTPEFLHYKSATVRSNQMWIFEMSIVNPFRCVRAAGAISAELWRNK